ERQLKNKQIFDPRRETLSSATVDFKGGKSRQSWLSARSGILRDAAECAIPTAQASADDQTVNSENDNGSDNGAYKAGRLSGRVPACGPSNQTGDQRACNTQQHCDDDAAGVTSRHKKFGNGPNNETNDDH